MIPRMWTEDPFSHSGEFYSIPPRSVIPKPVQDPASPAVDGVQPTPRPSVKPAPWVWACSASTSADTSS